MGTQASTDATAMKEQSDMQIIVESSEYAFNLQNLRSFGKEKAKFYETLSNEKALQQLLPNKIERTNLKFKSFHLELVNV